MQMKAIQNTSPLDKLPVSRRVEKAAGVVEKEAEIER
jgi:hypothetical protein